MKSIKLASGFAVSALALAIAGTAAAQETETEFTYTGEVEFNTILDLEDEFNDVKLSEEDEDVGDGDGALGLIMDVGVVHGPFSGTIGIESKNGETEATVGDLVITDGPISFGQVGSLIETDEYTYDLENAATQDVDAGLRYTMDGLQVQLEGSETAGTADSNDVGLGAKYADSIDALSFVVNTQVRMSDAVASAADAAGLDADPFVFAGAGVTYDLGIASIEAAFNYYTVGQVEDGVDQNGEDQSEVGVSLTTSPIDALSLGFHFQDEDLGEDAPSMKYEVDGSYAMAPITVSGYFEGTEADDGEGDTEFNNEVQGKVEYSENAIAAYGQVTQMLVDNADPEFELGASLTQENGVVYDATYTFQDNESNNVVLSASYNF